MNVELMGEKNRIGKGFLEAHDWKVLEDMNLNGTVFKNKSSNNCVYQRGVITLGALGGGSIGHGLGWDRVEGSHRRLMRVLSKECRVNGRNVVMEKVTRLENVARVPWKEVALFYHGSCRHRPQVPNIDCNLDSNKTGRKQKRDVQILVVEEEVAGGRLTLLGGENPVHAENLFMKLPRDKSAVEGLYQALRRWESKAPAEWTCRTGTEELRVAAMDGSGSRYMRTGATVARFGKGFGSKGVEVLDDPCLRRFMEAVERKVANHLPVFLRGVLRACLAAPLHGGGEALPSFAGWTGFVCGRNVFLCAHDDRDSSWSLVGVVAEDGGDEVVCYFVFPEKGVAVPMRHGDLLAFNAKEVHCVSARVNGSREAYCFSFYTKAEMAGAHNRDVEVPEALKASSRVMEEALRKARKSGRECYDRKEPKHL